MNPIADIDTLMSALYPHICQNREGETINAPSSLRPSTDESNLAIHDLVDAFADLFGLYPHCETVAVAIQTPLSINTSLYICPSPPTPIGFDSNVKDCLNHFITVARAVSNGQGDISQSRQRFIMHTYGLCYAAMRQRAILEQHDDGIWGSLVNPCKPEDENEEKLKDKVSDHLRRLSGLVTKFVEIISRNEANLGDETLEFHTLCLDIRDTMKDTDLEYYIDGYIYLQGVDRLLAYYFSLPIAISKILSLSTSLALSLDDKRPAIIVKPSGGARQFKAVMDVDHLRERFPLAKHIRWEEVERAFVNQADLAKGICWDSEEHVFSTKGPIIPHPEVTLINLWNDDESSQGLEVYIACSTTPCYASVEYAGVVNEQNRCLKFTMRTDDPEWCQLSTAEPWILPENTKTEVVEKLKDELLSLLPYLVDDWVLENRDLGIF